jgi:hypothetical protein
MRIKGLLMIMLLLISLPLIAAQDDGVEFEEEAGVAPDSALYGLDKAMERLSLALTFEKVKKTEKRLRHAEERLLEVQKMIEKGKAKHADKAQADHDELLEEVSEEIEGLDSDGSSEKAEEALEKVAKLRLKTQSHYEKVSAIKDRILERKAETMTEEQIEHLEQVFNKIKAKALDTEKRTEGKRGKIKTKLKALSELTDEELDELVGNLEERHEQAREDRANRWLARAEQKLAKARERLADAALDEDRAGEITANLDAMEELITEAKEAITNLDYDAAIEILDQIHESGNDVSKIARTLGKAKKDGNFDEVLGEMKDRIEQRHQERIDTVKEKVRDREKLDLKGEIKEQVNEKAKERKAKPNSEENKQASEDAQESEQHQDDTSDLEENNQEASN